MENAKIITVIFGLETERSEMRLGGVLLYFFPSILSCAPLYLIKPGTVRLYFVGTAQISINRVLSNIRTKSPYPRNDNIEKKTSRARSALLFVRRRR